MQYSNLMKCIENSENIFNNEASVGRGELFPLSCPKAVGCHSERQFSFSNGDNGWGWGGVLCIVFYVCLIMLSCTENCENKS